MNWTFRPGQEPQEQLKALEDNLGITNMRDVEVDETNGYLYIYTDTKKFRITMTEV